MKNTSKLSAFTLVELIVVITILAILATIAFISLSGYSRWARNSKTTTQVKNIVRHLEFQRLKGINYLSLASDTSAMLTGSSIHIWGYDSSGAFPGAYVAGDLDFSALKLNPADYVNKSFSGAVYKYWATSAGARYEIAATIETASDLDTYVTGSWYERNSWNLRGERESIAGNIFYLSGALADDLWFYIGDLVGISTWTYTITDIKWNEIHMDIPITTPGANIFLKTDETRHLIKKWDSNFAIDVWRWASYVPYR